MGRKRRYMAPAYITDQLEELRLQGLRDKLTIKRRSLRAAHERFREYEGPRVWLYPAREGRIVAEFEPDALGWAPDEEIL